MNIATVKYYDIANGEGVRTSVFVSGCKHHCKNCFNQEAWDFCYGEKFNSEKLKEIIDSLAPYYIAGLTVLGGEPFEKENQTGVLEIVKSAKEKYPDKKVWLYSGFTLEEILSGSRASGKTAEEILKYTDVLVDGRFIEELKDISLRFRGSSNQRIIDIKKSLERKETVLYAV